MLNPFNEKFNISKEKEKISKRRPINIKSLYKNRNDKIKFPDKVRNEISKILLKNEPRNINIQIKEKKNEIPQFKHKKAYTTIFQ